MNLAGLLSAILLACNPMQPADLKPSPLHESVERLKELDMHPIEGIWQIPGHESRLEIIRDSITPSGQIARYRIAVIIADDLSIGAGTVVGYATPTAEYGVYDSRIFTDVTPGRRLTPSAPRKFTLTLNGDESRLTAKRYGKNVIVRWWRLLPYMLRWTFSVDDKQAPETDGLVRIYPEPKSPQNPVYL